MNILSKRKAKQVQIVNCGRISDRQWLGVVSRRHLLATHTVTQAGLDEALAQINDFYVPVSPTAKTRCIDGRLDLALDEEQLGGQVPGGAPGAALAYRLGVDKDDLRRGTFLDDAEQMISMFLRLGLAPGAHRDEDNIGHKKVGCGAIDGMDAILAAMTDLRLVDDHERVVEQLLGDAFDRDTYLRVMGAAVVVNSRSKEYFRNRQAIVDSLEKRVPHSIVTLKGHHQECIVAVNVVPHSTLASTKFSEAFHGVQAFRYDIWHSRQIAALLLPRTDQLVDRQRFIMARVMYTVATLMVLTDGTQQLIMRVNA